MIGVALVVGGEASEAVEALEGEASEGGDAGKGQRCYISLVSLARRSIGRIPSCIWISHYRIKALRASQAQAEHVCVQPD